MDDTLCVVCVLQHSRARPTRRLTRPVTRKTTRLAPSRCVRGIPSPPRYAQISWAIHICPSFRDSTWLPTMMTRAAKEAPSLIRCRLAYIRVRIISSRKAVTARVLARGQQWVRAFVFVTNQKRNYHVHCLFYFCEQLRLTAPRVIIRLPGPRHVLSAQ